MTAKRNQNDQPMPIPVLEAAGPTQAGVVDFGAAAGMRKRLFQFATRPGKRSLGPTRSEFGCD